MLVPHRGLLQFFDANDDNYVRHSRTDEIARIGARGDVVEVRYDDSSGMGMLVCNGERKWVHELFGTILESVDGAFF